MPKIIVPSNIGTQLDNTLRQLVRAVEEVPEDAGLSTKQVEEIAEETAEEFDDTIIVTGPGVTYTSVSRETQIIKTYTVGSDPPTQFIVEWYANKQDYINGIQQSAAEAPTNVSFSPPTPATTRGQHEVVITFTPQAQASRINPSVLKFEVR